MNLNNFTEKLRITVDAAFNYAKENSFNYFLPVHILIILLQDDKLVSKTLKIFKVNKQDVLDESIKISNEQNNNSKETQIQSNLIHGAYLSGVKNLIFLGSSCVYPKNCKQPIKEAYLMKGELEKTNDAYAIAKIAGIRMCQSYNDQFKTNFASSVQKVYENVLLFLRNSLFVFYGFVHQPHHQEQHYLER